MDKLMVVTVGTSLFHSASWNKDNEDFKKVLGSYWENYAKHWAADDERKGLFTPEYRRKNDYGLEALFEKELTFDNANTWVDRLAPYEKYTPKTHKMRYSAEIATILGFGEKQTEKPWKDFLNDYVIKFLHDVDHKAGSTYHLAQHLSVYLQKLINGSPKKITAQPIPNLSSEDPTHLAEGLKEYYMYLDQALASAFEIVDIVISGGYKIYGFISALLMGNPKCRIIYQHEYAEYVIIQDKNSIELNSSPPERIEFPSKNS